MKTVNIVALVIGFLLLLFGADRLNNYSELIGNMNSQMPLCLASHPVEYCSTLLTQELFLSLRTTLAILFAALAIPVFALGITNTLRK